MVVRQGAFDGQRIVNGQGLVALQQAPERFDLVWRPRSFPFSLKSLPPYHTRPEGRLPMKRSAAPPICTTTPTMTGIGLSLC